MRRIIRVGYPARASGMALALLAMAMGQGVCAADDGGGNAEAVRIHPAAVQDDRGPDGGKKTPEASAPEPGNETLHRGRYVLSYFGRHLAEETFAIERTVDGGYRIVATFIPRDRDGDQVASTSEYVLDADRRFVRATYQPLDEDNLSATYEVKDGVLIATASDGQIQRIDLEEGDRIAGPHYVTDFFVLHPLDYDMGDDGEFVCHTFGFRDWRVHRCIVKPQRLRDDRMTHPLTGTRASKAVYRCRIDAGSKDFRTRSYLDEDGVAVKIAISAPIGSATIRLKKPEES